MNWECAIPSVADSVKSGVMMTQVTAHYAEIPAGHYAEILGHDHCIDYVLYRKTSLKIFCGQQPPALL